MKRRWSSQSRADSGIDYVRGRYQHSSHMLYSTGIVLIVLCAYECYYLKVTFYLLKGKNNKFKLECSSRIEILVPKYSHSAMRKLELRSSWQKIRICWLFLVGDVNIHVLAVKSCLYCTRMRDLSIYLFAIEWMRLNRILVVKRSLYARARET